MSRSRNLGGAARRFITAVAGTALLTLLLASASAQLKTVTIRDPLSGRLGKAVDGRVLVVPKPGVTQAQLNGLLAQEEAVSARPICHGRIWVVGLAQGQTVDEAVRAYARSNLVASAEPDVLEEYSDVPAAGGLDRPYVVPNDPRWPELWGMQKIAVDAAWNFTKGDSSVVLAIIDSGSDYTHPDLAGRTWTNPGEIAGDGIDNEANGYIDDVIGWDFYDVDNDPNWDDAGGYPEPHGTHVAGTAGATVDNATGVAGVAWNCQLMILRVGGAMGLPRSASFEAITYAGDNGADVVNMSYGGFFSDTYDTPIGYAHSMGVTLCAAAGNYDWEFTTDPSTWLSPVCNDGIQGVDNKIIGVAATDQSDLKASFSQYGGAYKLIDVSAPGVDILSTVPGGMYESWPGTSMACPHVVGLAGLVVSQLGKDTPDAVIDQIRSTTVNIDALNPGYEGKLGTGRIDAAGAVGFDAPPEPATAVNAFDTYNDEGGSITVTWKKSTDDGRGRNDVTGYELFRGTDPDPLASVYTKVATKTDLPPGSAGYIDETVTDGINYYYFVRVFDAANQADSNVGGPAMAADDSSPPAVSNLVAQDTQADAGRSITLTWVGYTAPADLTTFRVYRSQAEFTAVTEEGVELVEELANRNARNYIDRADDPDADPADPTKDVEPFDLTDYWYAVTALDEVDNEIETVESVGPVQCAPNLSISFNLGMRMVTVPALPIQAAPADVFSFQAEEEVSFARYDPVTGAYHIYADNPNDPFLTIAPGRAFWLDRDIPSLIAVGGHVVEDPETEVPIEIGWNQVGSPYDAEYAFANIDVRDPLGTDQDITSSDLVRQYAWRYDALARGYRLISPVLPNGEPNLPAREGMWVYALSSGLKLVFENNVAVADSRAAATAEPAKLDGWQMRLVAKAAGMSDTDNWLGVCSTAEAIGPILSPPAAGRGVDLYFPAGGTGRAALDLREAPPVKSSAVVECGVAGARVELAWPDLSQVPNHIRPVLTDLATGRSVYMRTAAGYSYRARKAGEQREFEISFAAPAAGPVLEQLAATPTKAGGVELTFWLNRTTADVAIEVLNVAGRPVAQVPAGPGQIGLNRVLWNGRGAAGQGVPRGMYLIRVTAVAEDNGEVTSALKSVNITGP